MSLVVTPRMGRDDRFFRDWHKRPISTEQWGLMRLDRRRIVLRQDWPWRDVWLSTVWTGEGHFGTPFETMTFSDDDRWDCLKWGHTTPEQALKWHYLLRKAIRHIRQQENGPGSLRVSVKRHQRRR